MSIDSSRRSNPNRGNLHGPLVRNAIPPALATVRFDLVHQIRAVVEHDGPVLRMVVEIGA